jgi:AAA+ ATPase superfamily predicted ATPase
VRDGETTINPFRFGALVLDDAFTDREEEVAALEADMLNGQDVVVLSPRRYGKSSLAWRVMRGVTEDGRALVAHVDLMTTPTRERLAAKLAATIHADVASPLLRARARLRVFQGLRIAPAITVDPQDGTLGFTFAAGHASEDIDATIEDLLELPGRLAAQRGRRVALVLDEFQEVVDIDAGLTRLMRSAFQAQPEVAHVYLGSRRHMMRTIFSDANEPFWRSAKSLELDVIEPARFRGYIERQFGRTGRAAGDDALDGVLAISGGHPYATQELCYFLWQDTPPGGRATADGVERALGAVLRSENAHFTLVWERASRVQRVLLQALAREPGRPLTTAYRRRHDLPAPSSVQAALTALEREELALSHGGAAHLAEPFLAEWLRRGEG